MALMLAAMLALAGCSSLPSGDGGPTGPHPDLAEIPDAVPQTLPRSSRGNPASYSVFGKTYYVRDSASGYIATGIASWYGRKFQGRPTSSGEPYDMYAMTAAHKTLPIPTFVRVTNLRNNRQVVVKINDRGPFHDGRIIDLSYAAAWKLGIVNHGSAPVRVEAIVPGSLRTASTSPGAAPASLRAASAAETIPAAYTTSEATDAAGETGEIRGLVNSPANGTGAVGDATTSVLRQAGNTRDPATSASEAPDETRYLQAGAFTDQENARTLADYLRGAGLAQVFVMPPPDGGTYYRVRLGPFEDPVALDAARQRLRALNVPFTSVPAGTASP